jgi:hypothetical protein
MRLAASGAPITVKHRAMNWSTKLKKNSLYNTYIMVGNILKDELKEVKTKNFISTEIKVKLSLCLTN